MRLLSFSTFIVGTSAFLVGKSPNNALRKANDSYSTSLFAKKILLSFDGTGNEVLNFSPDKDATITHVLKLHLLAGGSIRKTNEGHFPDQICLYERGVSTRATKKYAKIYRLAAGDLSLQINPMRKRLQEVYEEGDKLYMIGFSRGAAAARLFASELNDKGLRTKNGKTFKSPPIEFLGCFDTVSMQVSKKLITVMRTLRKMTITPSKVLGEGGVVATNIKCAVHNVAMDDNRMWTFPMSFNPVLMGNEDKVHETWFAGEHGDVGGAYFSKGLSDHCLEHMMEWMGSSEKLGKNKLSFLKPEDVSLDSLNTGYRHLEIQNDALLISPDASKPTHLVQDQQRNDPSYRKIGVAQNDEIMPDAKVKIHKSVVHHMEIRKEKGLFYPVNENLKESNFVVVGSLGEELEIETKKLGELLQYAAPEMTVEARKEYPVSTGSKAI